MQCLREGDVSEGRQRLHALIADHPRDQVAADQQLGQSYIETEEWHEARQVLEAGIDLAQHGGDGHAAAEMQGLLDSIAGER
jgi:uncharacterized protein HemY